MFTPPPSPLPRIFISPPDDDDELDPLVDLAPLPEIAPPSGPSRIATASSRSEKQHMWASPPPSPTAVEAACAKKAHGRRMRALVVLVPLLLVFLTLASHRCLSPRQTPPPSHSPAASLPTIPPMSISHWRRTLPHHLRPRQIAPGASSPSATPLSQQQLPLAPPATPAPAIPNPFPQPFDVSLSSNFTTASCQTFFNTFTQDLSFRACRSFGLLFANSHEFFTQETNLTVLNTIVWGTCNTRPSEDDCIVTMNDLATTLKGSACTQDLAAGNALAIAALVGFSSYAMFREAGCIVDASTKAYCYLEALKATTPADAYIYSLPLGIQLPNTNPPTCSTCTSQVLAVFARYAAANATLPIAKTYPPAWNATTSACGNGYAPEVEVANGALRTAASALSLFVAAALGTWLVL